MTKKTILRCLSVLSLLIGIGLTAFTVLEEPAWLWGTKDEIVLNGSVDLAGRTAATIETRIRHIGLLCISAITGVILAAGIELLREHAEAEDERKNLREKTDELLAKVTGFESRTYDLWDHWTLPNADVALGYVAMQLRGGSVQSVWNTHVRLHDQLVRYDPNTLQDYTQALTAWLNRSGTSWTDIRGPRCEKDATEAFVAGLRTARKNANYACYHLTIEAPVINFIILDYGSYKEVLFGWHWMSQHKEVFLCKEPSLVSAFGDIFTLLKSPEWSQPVTNLEDLIRLGDSRSRTELERLGTDDEALQYVVALYEQAATASSPRLIRVRDTHFRFGGIRTLYSQLSYQRFEEGLKKFLRDNKATLVTGWPVDEKFISAIQNAAGGDSEANLTCYRMLRPSPVMNFIILDFDSGHSEVLLGWGQSGKAVGTVFKSQDPRMVTEFERFYEILTEASVSEQIRVTNLQTAPIQRAHAAEQATVVYPDWCANVFDEFLSSTSRGSEDSSEREPGDLRIVTSFFIDWETTSAQLEKLLEKGLRVKVLLMNPQNESLIYARCGVRTDKHTPENAKREGMFQLEALGKLASDAGGKGGTLEVYTSNIMPTGFVAQTRDRVVIGLMPARKSYLAAPMIVASSDTLAWKVFDADWTARWKEAKPKQS
ncbi:MAG TPA: hypothetical protein VJX67_18575 [Blastocatellia bacterium]|nr:hypothetical protein [Blastocatellia bacterium]